MKKLKYLTALVIILSTICNSHVMAQLVISGNIIDANTEKPIEFCNIAVVEEQSGKMITGTTTDSRGEFSLKVQSTKPCLLKATFIGYQEMSIGLNLQDFAEKKKETVRMDNLRMLPGSETLEEVKIIGRVKQFEMDADHLVMNIDQATTATVVNAFELLRKVPGVSIDKDENLTLNGRSGVLFQFNGRDMKIGWEAVKAMLKGMNPAQIERFEVITNPSAKYDAEGTAGIINILMKKNQSRGFNGSINAGGHYSESFSAQGGLNLNYVDDKWTTSFNYDGSLFQNKITNSSIRQVVQGTDTTLFDMPPFEVNPKFQGHNLSLSTDYLINDNNSVGIYTAFNNNSQPEMLTSTRENISHSPDLSSFISSVVYDQSDVSRGNNFLVGANYIHKFDSLGTKLQIDLSATTNTSYNNRNTESSYFILANDSITAKEQLDHTTNGSYESYVAKLDFQKPTKTWGTFEAGAKVAFTSLDNSFESINKALAKSTLIQKEGLISGQTERDNFLFSEDIVAAYLSYSKNFGMKTSLRAGLRFEHTLTEGISKLTDSTNSNSYSDLFPSVSLNHNFNKFNSLSLSYNYRISRPDYSQLNPFVQKTSDYIYHSGNPLLKPQYSHNLSLNYSLFYMAFLSVNYGYTDDFVSEEVVLLHESGAILQPESGAILQRPGNIAKNQNLNVGLSLVVPVGEWLFFNFFGQMNYTTVQSGSGVGAIDIENTSYMFFANANLNLPKKFKFSLSGYYMSGGLWAIYEYDASYSMNVGLSRAFLKDDRLNVNLSVNNLFAKRDIKVDFSHNGITQSSSTHIPGAMLSLNIRYNFGTAYQNKKLSKIKTDDMNERAKGGKGEAVQGAM